MTVWCRYSVNQDVRSIIKIMQIVLNTTQQYARPTAKNEETPNPLYINKSKAR